MRPSEDETATDPLLPRTAVCDRHQDRPAQKLVAAGDGRGDCYLCSDCLDAFNAGGPVPFLRHSPSIRRRADIPVRRRVGRRRALSGKPGAEARFLQTLFAHADISLVLIDDNRLLLPKHPRVRPSCWEPEGSGQVEADVLVFDMAVEIG